MEKPNYFSKYLFDWDLMDVVMGGKSVMDSPYFVSPMINLDHVNGFLSVTFSQKVIRLMGSILKSQMLFAL